MPSKPTPPALRMQTGFSPSLTAASVMAGSVKDVPLTHPTMAARSGDMPGNRVGLSFVLRLSIGQPV
jgi:hypothetical protein